LRKSCDWFRQEIEERVLQTSVFGVRI